MEENLLRLEEETFRSVCFDETMDDLLAHVEILPSCGMVLDRCRNLGEYPVCDGDTLTVVVVPDDTCPLPQSPVARASHAEAEPRAGTSAGRGRKPAVWTKFIFRTKFQI